MISPERTPQRQAHSAEHARLGVDSEVGVLRRVILAPARPRARAADADQQGRAPVRRRAVGEARAAGARRVRRHAPRDRGVTVLHLQDLLAADARGRRGLRASRPRHDRPRGARQAPWGARPRLALAVAAGRRGRRVSSAASASATCRSPRRASSPRRPTLTTSRSRRCRTTSSPATPPRGSTTASASTRWRSRPARARRVNVDAIYRHHPLFAGRDDFHDLERRARRARDARGRRHPRHRQRLRPRRHGRAHPPGRRRAARPAACSRPAPRRR